MTPNDAKPSNATGFYAVVHFDVNNNSNNNSRNFFQISLGVAGQPHLNAESD